jgi:hypothetical protein
MRVGRFKVGKVYENNKTKWAVFGKNQLRIWVVCYDETRNPKDLVFDLEYDACAYLEGFIEWQTEEIMQQGLAAKAAESVFGKGQGQSVNADKRKRIKAKKKMAKLSRKRNR